VFHFRLVLFVLKKNKKTYKGRYTMLNKKGNLYIITGPAGVGKSTISRKIAEDLEKSVLLEGDDFTDK